MPARWRCYAAVFLSSLLLAGVLLAGCGTGEGSESNDSEIKDRRLSLQQRSAREFAERTLGLLAAGDWGAAWDNWSTDSQAVISRQDYIALNDRCDSPTGYEYTVTDVRIINSSNAEIDVKAPSLDIQTTYALVSNDANWRLVITDSERALYSRGLADLEANHVCPMTDDESA